MVLLVYSGSYSVNQVGVGLICVFLKLYRIYSSWISQRLFAGKICGTHWLFPHKFEANLVRLSGHISWTCLLEVNDTTTPGRLDWKLICTMFASSSDQSRRERFHFTSEETKRCLCCPSGERACQICFCKFWMKRYWTGRMSFCTI